MNPQMTRLYHFCWFSRIKENPMESFRNMRLPIVETMAWMKVIFM